MTDNKKLAELLFPDITKTPDDIEKMFPPRDLKEGARVTRFAPSPTGYLHIGGLFGALVDVLTAKVSGGISYLRIEDTDKKREIDDGVSAIINGFNAFGIEFDEGVTGFGTEKGDYGPYTQSQRVEIYQTIAKSLVEKGLAYPCFCTADELSALREQQEQDEALIRGYFGKYAKCRCLTYEQIEENIKAGKPYVLRFLRRNPDLPFRPCMRRSLYAYNSRYQRRRVDILSAETHCSFQSLRIQNAEIRSHSPAYEN